MTADGDLLDGTVAYLDTNIVIALVERRHERLRALVERVKAGRLSLVTSELTLAEVVVLPLRDGDDRLLTRYRDLFSHSDLIASVPITRTILERSGEIRAREGGKLADAIHLATAETSGCRVFLSSDKRIRPRPPMLRIGIEASGGDA